MSFEGIDDLASLFGAIAIAPRRKLAAACIHDQFLCPGEGLLLQIVAALQRKDVLVATEILCNRVARAVARLAVTHMQRLANGLAQQGLLLPRRLSMPAGFLGAYSYPAAPYIHQRAKTIGRLVDPSCSRLNPGRYRVPGVACAFPGSTSLRYLVVW